jgi:hypothetical protein
MAYVESTSALSTMDETETDLLAIARALEQLSNYPPKLRSERRASILEQLYLRITTHFNVILDLT